MDKHDHIHWAIKALDKEIILWRGRIKTIETSINEAAARGLNADAPSVEIKLSQKKKFEEAINDHLEMKRRFELMLET